MESAWGMRTSWEIHEWEDLVFLDGLRLLRFRFRLLLLNWWLYWHIGDLHA
jgi:hypothetical protein